MLKISRIIIICIATIYAQPSWAILHLKLTQGVNSAIPMSVLPFTGEVPTVSISSIVIADLQNSGRFKNQHIDDSKIAQADNTDQAIDLRFWKKQKVNYVIKGNVEITPALQQQITVKLYDVYNNHNGKILTPILQKQFTINNAQLRALAHHISDLIYQKVLGVQGVFSSKIAYVLARHDDQKAPSYQLMIADYDGENAAAVLVSKQPIMSPAWSPDGKKLAYVSFESGLPAIYISNIATGKRRLITNFPGINSAPAFSPDGNKLALVLSRGAKPNIYIVNLSTGGLQKITRISAINTAPAWSSNGQQLLFTSNRGGDPQIYQITLNSKVVHRVSFTGNYNTNGHFLPGGHSMVLLHRGADTNGQFSIALQNINSGAINILAQGKVQSPSVAPNGSMIVYTQLLAPGKSQLAMVSSDGHVQLQLPSEDGAVQAATWSPFLTGESFNETA